MNPEGTTISEYLGILRRRKWYLTIPAIVIFVIAALVAFLLPPVYRSSATILIESADVPPELVQSTISVFAEQQIQIINQRVTTTQKLVEIINKYNLYAQKRKNEPIFTIAEKMRDDISLELIGGSSLSSPKKTSGGQSATIAFRLSFDYPDAGTAQRVTNELVSLYLSENARTRQEKASETTAFLTGEADRLQRSITELDRQLSDLKAQYQGSLPEQLNYNLGIIQRAEEEMRALDIRMQSLTQRQIFLESELLQIDPSNPEAVPVAGQSDQLRALRSQFVALSGRYGAEHPDVIRLRRELDALEQDQNGGLASTSDLNAEQDRLRADLASLQQRYSADHPDVLKAKRQLASVEAQLSEARAKPKSAGRKQYRNENPAFARMKADLQATKAELDASAKQRDQLLAQISETEQKVMKTPLVERDYLRLQRDYEASVRDFKEIKDKQKAAELGEALETERKGERFTLIEPAQAPDQPIKPNRLAILALGFLLACASGVGLAILAEAADSAIYGVRQVVAITGVSPLVLVPFIKTRTDIRREQRERLIFLGATASILLAAVTFIHFKVVPLDTVWATLQRDLQNVPVVGKLVTSNL